MMQIDANQKWNTPNCESAYICVKQLRRELLQAIGNLPLLLEAVFLLQCQDIPEAVQFNQGTAAYFDWAADLIPTAEGYVVFVNKANHEHAKSRTWGQSQFRFRYGEKWHQPHHKGDHRGVIKPRDTRTINPDGGATCLKPVHAALCILLAVLLLPLCSCGRKADARTKDGRIIVSYWEKWTGFEDDAMQAVVDDFNNSQNRIFVKKLAVSEMLRKLMLATAGGNPPDVAGLWSSYIPDFAQKGALTPLNKMIEQAGIKADDYIPTYWQQCAYQGFMWALPSTPTTLALHWNKKLFREAGLDPNRPPQSSDELDKMSDQLTIVEIQRDDKWVRVRYPDLTEDEKHAKNFKLVQVGHLPTQPGWWMPEWVWWFGGHLWDGDRKITANSPEDLQTFDWLRRSSEKFGIENLRSFGATFGNFASPSDPFLAGKVAMELQGVWMYNFISKYAPQLEWGAAPFPAKDPARFPQVTLAECDVLLIPKGAAHPKEAFEFIHYVNTPGPMEKLCLGQRKFSPFVKVSDEFMRHHPNPYIQTFIDLAKSPQAHCVPRLTVWAEYLDELNVAADRVIALDATPQQALDQVQRRIQWKLDRVTRRWDAIRVGRLKEWSNYVAR